MCVHAQLLSPVGLCDPMDYSLSGSSVHEIFQARILEWVSISSSKGSSVTCSQKILDWDTVFDSTPGPRSLRAWATNRRALVFILEFRAWIANLPEAAPPRIQPPVGGKASIITHHGSRAGSGRHNTHRSPPRNNNSNSCHLLTLHPISDTMLNVIIISSLQTILIVLNVFTII